MMRLNRKQRQQIAAQDTTQTQTLPPPLKGWNTRDALTAMDPLDAVLLDNFYPDVGGVLVRNGFLSYATGVSSSVVKTLAEYNSGSTRKFLAAAGGGIYDISASGAAGAAIKSGYGSDAWQTVPFLSRLFFANGVDTLQVFDGSSLADASFTGVTLSTLVGCIAYQQRLFFWANNSTGFWFAQLNSISGTLSFFDLASFSPNGGNLIAATRFSHDGGNGVLDFIAFIMSSGDAIVYYGNDPSNFPNNWQMLGIYHLSPPVNIRAVCAYGGESFYTTYDDHVGIEAQMTALQSGNLPPRSKVSSAVQAAVIANKAAFGWQALFYAKGRRLLFNIPNTDGSFDQHVQNVGSSYQDGMTGQTVSPWCRFRNMPANCWGLFRDTLYFGSTAGNVYQADVGNLDNLGVINAMGQQAWNTFNSPSRKEIQASRPVIQSTGTPSFTFSLGFDYGAINIPTTVSTNTPGSPWDTSPWDTSPWSPETTVNTLWHGAGGSGVAVGWTVAIASNRANTWLRSDLRGTMGKGL